MDASYLVLSECCQMTAGYSRTLIVDFQRKQIDFVDNQIAELFRTGANRKQTVGALLAGFDCGDRATARQYFRYLLDKEYCFLCDADELGLFPALVLEFDHPALITNALIDLPAGVDEAYLACYQRFITELAGVGCEAVQIRSYHPLPEETLRRLLGILTESTVHQVELLLRYNEAIPVETYRQLLADVGIINDLVLHTAPRQFRVPLETTQNLLATTQVVDSDAHCGLVSPGYFNLTLDHFTEAVGFNTCLNRKIALDPEGLIRNCPSLKTTYGAILETSLLDVARSDAFRRVWHLKKDTIEGCRICEFRNICTDCRAFQESDLALGKPVKCGYDPVTTHWAS